MRFGAPCRGLFRRIRAARRKAAGRTAYWNEENQPPVCPSLDKLGAGFAFGLQRAAT